MKDWIIILLFFCVKTIASNLPSSCPATGAVEFAVVENEKLKWHFSYYTAKVDLVESNTGSQFTLKPCKDKGAGFVSIRHLRDDWSEAQLQKGGDWVVCLDTVNEIVQVGFIDAAGQTKNRGIEDAPNFSCCFMYLRNKWFPDTLALATNTSKNALYLQSKADYSQLSSGRPASQHEKLLSSFRVTPALPRTELYEWRKTKEKKFIRLVSLNGRMKVPYKEAQATCLEIKGTLLADSMSEAETDGVIQYMKQARVSAIWLSSTAPASPNSGCSILSSFPPHHSGNVPCTDSFYIICSTEVPNEPAVSSTFSIPTIAIKEKTADRPMFYFTSYISDRSSHSYLLEAVVTTEIPQSGNDVPFFSENEIVVDFRIKKGDSIYQIGNVSLAPICGFGFSQQTITLNISKVMRQIKVKKPEVCGSAFVKGVIRSNRFTKFSLDLASNHLIRMRRTSVKRSESWTMCFQLFIQGGSYANSTLLQDEFQFINIETHAINSQITEVHMTFAGMNQNSNFFNVLPEFKVKVSLNQWNHFCSVKRDDKINLYVNGKHKDDVTSQSHYKIEDVFFPAGNFFTFRPHGLVPETRISEFNVWSVALTADVISDMESSCPSSYPTLPQILSWNSIYIEETSKLIDSNTLLLSTPCGDTESVTLGSGQVATTIFCNEDFLKLSNVSFYFPKTLSSAENVIWNNTDTTIYLDVNVTNINYNDFTCLKDFVDTKVFLSETPFIDSSKYDVTKKVTFPKEAKQKPLNRGSTVDLRKIKLELHPNKVAANIKTDRVYVLVELIPQRSLFSTVQSEWIISPLAKVLEIQASQNKDYELVHFSMSSFPNSRIRLTTEIQIKTSTESVDVSSISLKLWYSHHETLTPTPQTFYLRKRIVPPHSTDSLFFSQVFTVDSSVQFCGWIYVIMQVDETEPKSGERDPNNNYLSQKFFKRCEKDVLSVNEVVFYTPGSHPFNVVGSYTLSFVLACPTEPICTLPTPFQEKMFQLKLKLIWFGSDGIWKEAQFSIIDSWFVYNKSSSMIGENKLRLYVRTTGSIPYQGQDFCETNISRMQVIVTPYSSYTEFQETITYNNEEHVYFEKLPGNHNFCGISKIRPRLSGFTALCKKWIPNTKCGFILSAYYETNQADLSDLTTDPYPQLNLRFFISTRFNEILLNNRKFFLSYSPHALKFTKKEMFDQPNPQLHLEINDVSGVLLDVFASKDYCQSKVELCASVGTWTDPDDKYIADDGAIRCDSVFIECPDAGLVIDQLAMDYENDFIPYSDKRVKVSGKLKNKGRDIIYPNLITEKLDFFIQAYFSYDETLKSGKILKIPTPIKFRSIDLYKLQFFLSPGESFSFSDAILDVSLSKDLCNPFMFIIFNMTSWSNSLRTRSRESFFSIPIRADCSPQYKENVDFVLGEVQVEGKVTLKTNTINGITEVENGTIAVDTVTEIRIPPSHSGSFSPRLSNYYDHPPVLRLYLSIDPCLDVGKSHATNDEQLLAVSLIGTILQKSDFIADPVVASGDSFQSTEKRSLTVKSRYVINVKDMGFNYCGFIYLITQLDTHNIHDLDSTNNIIIKQINYTCPSDVFQIFDRNVEVTWSRSPIIAGVPTSINFQLCIVVLSLKISEAIADTEDGSANVMFEITTSSDYEGKENIVPVTTVDTSWITSPSLTAGFDGGRNKVTLSATGPIEIPLDRSCWYQKFIHFNLVRGKNLASWLEFVRTENNRATAPIEIVCEELDNTDLLANFFVQNPSYKKSDHAPADVTLSFTLNVQVFFTDRETLRQQDNNYTEDLFDYELYLQRGNAWNRNNDILLPHIKSSPTQQLLKEPVQDNGKNIKIQEKVVVSGNDIFRTCCLGIPCSVAVWVDSVTHLLEDGPSFGKIREKNEHNNIASSFIRIDQSYCSSVPLFLSIDDFWLITPDEMGHVSRDPSTSFVLLHLNFFASHLLSPSLSNLSCVVSISAKQRDDVIASESFVVEERLQNNFGLFVGGNVELNERVKMNLSSCESFVTFAAFTRCSIGSFAAEDEKLKLVYISCFGRVVTWDNFQLQIASDSVKKNISPLTFNVIFPYTLQFTAQLKNNGVYRINGYQFFYEIETLSRNCNWSVNSLQSLNELNVYVLDGYSTSSVEKQIAFVPAECACANIDGVTDATLRFSLYESKNWTYASYTPSHVDIDITIDCSLYPSLPALAFYVRPYVINVSQWCVASHEVSECFRPSGVVNLAADTSWHVQTETLLGLGQVKNPPSQYNDIDLSSFPLPVHSFYLLPPVEGLKKSNNLKLDVAPDNQNYGSQWYFENNDYRHTDYYKLSLPTILEMGTGNYCGRKFQMKVDARVGGEQPGSNEKFFYKINSLSGKETQRIRLLCPGDLISTFDVNLKYNDFNILELSPEKKLNTVYMSLSVAVIERSGVSSLSIPDYIFFRAYFSEDLFLQTDMDLVAVDKISILHDQIVDTGNPLELEYSLYFNFKKIDYETCCRSNYLLISWHRSDSWSTQGLPDDTIPDNDFVALPIHCECKQIDLSFDDFKKNDVAIIENSQTYNREIDVGLRIANLTQLYSPITIRTTFTPIRSQNGEPQEVAISTIFSDNFIPVHTNSYLLQHFSATASLTGILLHPSICGYGFLHNTIDPFNTIDEINEDNNIHEAKVLVRCPGDVYEVSLTSSQVNAGLDNSQRMIDIDVAFKIENIGSYTVRSSELALYLYFHNDFMFDLSTAQLVGPKTRNDFLLSVSSTRMQQYLSQDYTPGTLVRFEHFFQVKASEEMCLKRYGHGSIHLLDASLPSEEFFLENNIATFHISLSLWDEVCNYDVLASSINGVWFSLNEYDVIQTSTTRSLRHNISATLDVVRDDAILAKKNLSSMGDFAKIFHVLKSADTDTELVMTQATKNLVFEKSSWMYVNGYYYLSNFDKYSFNDSGEICSDRNFRLALLKDPTIMQKLDEKSRVSNSYWIGENIAIDLKLSRPTGLTDRASEGDWMWLDGTPALLPTPSTGSKNVELWNTGEPNYSTAENCAVSYFHSDSWKFEAKACTKKYQPLCQGPNSGSSAVWGRKKINPRPQSCLCLTCSGCPSNDNDDVTTMIQKRVSWRRRVYTIDLQEILHFP